MEENLDLEQRKQKFRSLKKFFKTNLKMKQKLLSLAPSELDDVNVESRIKYTDKLFNALEELEIEFIIIVREIFDDDPELIEKIKEYFLKSKVALKQMNYIPGSIQKLYREQFTNMSPELVEKVKKGSWGHVCERRELFPQLIGRVVTINELLHLMHTYIQNDDEILVLLPVLKNKVNDYGETITLYGEETETAKKLFEGFPEELDVGKTYIVSFKDKILMMVRDVGHALSIDLDIRNPNEIEIRYFVPKICNEEMVRALPGINARSISSNGATGFFLSSTNEVVDKIINFIEKIPLDDDIPKHEVLPGCELIENSEKQFDGEEQQREFNEKDAQTLITTDGENGPRTGIVGSLIEELRREAIAIKNTGENILVGDGQNVREYK